MAAGIIQGTVTTTAGETIELSWLVDDTGTPTKWWNTSYPVNASGVGWAFGTGAMGATVPRFTLATDDPAVAILGAAADAASVSTTIKAALRGIATALGITALDRGPGAGGASTLRVTVDNAQVEGSNYETVAASATDQVMGGSGAAGDFLAEVLIIPATTSPGAVSIKDGAGSAITIFTGGASSVSNLVPFAVPLGIACATAWKLTTGANVSAIAVGKFT